MAIGACVAIMEAWRAQGTQLLTLETFNLNVYTKYAWRTFAGLVRCITAYRRLELRIAEKAPLRGRRSGD